MKVTTEDLILDAEFDIASTGLTVGMSIGLMMGKGVSQQQITEVMVSEQLQVQCQLAYENLTAQWDDKTVTAILKAQGWYDYNLERISRNK